MTSNIDNQAIIRYDDSIGAFDIKFGFCMLRFHLPEYIRSCGVSDIEMLDRDVFRYISGDSEEYESISRRILGESDAAPIPYAVVNGGYRLQQYDVDVMTELKPDEVIQKICDVCERGDATWELRMVSN